MNWRERVKNNFSEFIDANNISLIRLYSRVRFELYGHEMRKGIFCILTILF